MSQLEKRMVLHSFICSQFGFPKLSNMLDCLEGVQWVLLGSGESQYAHALASKTRLGESVVSIADLARYDMNISAHSKEMGMSSRKSWKPFQYLALLFTERYLDLFFEDSEKLIEDLNKWNVKKFRALNIPPYTAEDISTLAIQSATGSGKTLLLHANILQYCHYLRVHKMFHKLNKVILVTPDEGLSQQHLLELRASNIPAKLFSDSDMDRFLSNDNSFVDIIDLHKLDEKKGVKRVALDAFEDNNLVLVDEGHLGTGGKVWRKRRKQLAKNGFTFEYSATFNQAVSNGSNEIKMLRDEYGKSILFDYSYKYFYEDGYGKDYKIFNLQNSDDGEANNLYLLACLLTFFQQCHVYGNNVGQWRGFNLSPPLWVFLGRTVTGQSKASTKETESDVVKIVKFLAWIQGNENDVVQGIKRLIGGDSGLLDEQGANFFSQAFTYIENMAPEKIYDEMCTMVFHGKGQLNVSYMSMWEELQLSAGDNKPYGVINVGEARGLFNKIQETEIPQIRHATNIFSGPLFPSVDHDNSPVNIVIGARKFAAGWNSWRVSTMGLMHVGTGEGPQIIQMFGRGVRLRGHGFSLKRHKSLIGVAPTNSDQLKMVETLNVFGLKANYMDKFKRYLGNEGISTDNVVFQLPIVNQFNKDNDLKIIRKNPDVQEFEYSSERIELPGIPEPIDFVMLDLYHSIQHIESVSREDGTRSLPNTSKLEDKHVLHLNKQNIYFSLLERKQQSNWHNLIISRQAIVKLLENNEWYELRVPPEKLMHTSYQRVKEWEDIATELIGLYANNYWRRMRNVWEHKHLEATTLDDDDPNFFTEYSLTVSSKEEELVQDMAKLEERVASDNYDPVFNSGTVRFEFLNLPFHAYRPLLKAEANNVVHISPVPLNEGEADFVHSLTEAIKYMDDSEFLKSKQIYLMRNQNKGKGVSFFDDFKFYPDFILWINDSTRQDILFIDPKGLVHFDRSVKSKVDLHSKIKATEEKIRKTQSNLFLHSYIWSNTRLEDIGSDETLTVEKCEEMGIFFANERSHGILKLLKDALADKETSESGVSS